MFTWLSQTSRFNYINEQIFLDIRLNFTKFPTEIIKFFFYEISAD